MKFIQTHIEAIRRLCAIHKVKKLFVFGSVLTSRFNEKSDIDLLVDFNPDIDLYDYADNYFGLKDAFERLFGREVDLIEDRGIKNPLFRRNIDSHKQLIYG